MEFPCSQLSLTEEDLANGGTFEWHHGRDMQYGARLRVVLTGGREGEVGAGAGEEKVDWKDRDALKQRKWRWRWRWRGK